MNPTRIILYPLLAILAASLLAPGSWAQDLAHVRFAHLDGGLPKVDLHVNGELAAAGLAYGDATTHVSIPAGAAELIASLAGASVELFREILALAPGPATIILKNSPESQLSVVREDLESLASGSARVALFNLLDVAAQVSLSAPDGSLALEADLASQEASNAIEVETGTYQIQIAGDAEDLAERQFSRSLAARSANLLVIHGSADAPQLRQLAAAAEAEDESARLRFIHAIQGAAPLDIRLDGQLLIPGLSFAMPTPHIALPAGLTEVSVSLGAAEIMSERLSLRAGEMSSIALMRSGAGLEFLHVVDAVAGVDERSAVASLVNAIPDSVISHLQLESGAIIALNVPFADAGHAAKILPGAQAMTLHLNIAGEQGEVPIPSHYFNAGSHYTLVALAGGVFTAPSLLIAETSLARKIQTTMPSPTLPTDEPVTPSAEETTIEAPPAEQPSATETPSPQPEPQELETAEEHAEETPKGASEPQADESALTPYAMVDLNPDAALHLRQYPSIEAMSLGLLPAESQLMVLGRRGPSEKEPGEAEALPVTLGAYGNPAADLLPYQDLPAADTWLYAMIMTPDEGALYGWVNALFLRVYQANGEPQRLASLPQVRQNQPGSAHNTDIRPPSLADRVAAKVVGLKSDAMLNLRRRNDASSEVLRQIPPEEIMGILGLDADETWAFVEFQPEIGNPIKGWVSMQFIQLLLNGEPVQAAALRALDPGAVPQISGLVAGGIQAVEMEDSPQPMEGIIGEVNVNFDSALHLRRYPDATSESLALIPPGTWLSLEGITENGDWYRVRYDGAEGWAASPYLELSMDGRKYPRAYLERQLPRFADSGF